MPTSSMLVGSPSAFSNSPTTGYLSEYNYDSPRFCRAAALTPPTTRKQYDLKLKIPPLSGSPKRSCLVVRDPEAVKLEELAKNKKAIRTKKKVVFADDEGHALTHVRIMSEPSSCPPVLSLEFLAHFTQGLVSPVPQNQWTLDFRQPASDYLDFRQKIETNKVSLENVIIKEGEGYVMGTVKVKNMSFTKEVIVRVSWDDWKSQEDTFCTYQKIGGAGGSYALYDTFSFKFTLPPSTRKVEFCICYRCEGNEYWDNNEGKNYILTNRSSPLPEQEMFCLNPPSQNNVTSPTDVKTSKYLDPMASKISSWSEFASWNHVDANTPYW